MARFYGDVGFGVTAETDVDGDSETTDHSGLWEDVITEYSYRGDVIRNTRKLETGQGVNDDIVVGNSISIVADTYAIEHFLEIKYVRWNGVLWNVTTVTVQRPRLILDLGSVYNGPTP
jgi:hypothetical protein